VATVGSEPLRQFKIYGGLEPAAKKKFLRFSTANTEDKYCYLCHSHWTRI